MNVCSSAKTPGFIEARRLTLPQVSLYLGAWVLAVGAALLTFFPYPALAGAPAVILAWAAAAPAAWIGVRDWRRGYYRVAIAFLLALCLVVARGGAGHVRRGGPLHRAHPGQRRAWNCFTAWSSPSRPPTRRSGGPLLAGLPVCWWLRRFTRAPVFSLMFAALPPCCAWPRCCAWGCSTGWIATPAAFISDLIPCAALFMAAGFGFERLPPADDSRYFYPFAVAFTWAALCGVATFHEPWAAWLNSVAPWTRGQIEYLFLINAGIYFLLDRLCDRFSSPQVRIVGKSFRFVIPGHVMTSLLLLGIECGLRLRKRASTNGCCPPSPASSYSPAFPAR